MSYEHDLNHLLIAIVVSIVILPFLAKATDHQVGGDYGWGLDGNYKVWAQSQEFYVGDTLGEFDLLLVCIVCIAILC